MTQLADRVQQVKNLKARNSRSSKYLKKEIVSYVEIYKIDQISYAYCIEESEVNVAELKSGSYYVCKLLKPFKQEESHRA